MTLDQLRGRVVRSALVVAIILSSAVLATMPVTATGSPYYSRLVQSSIIRACSFLSSLYNDTLHLVSDTPSSRTYYVSSDNLLAQAALAQCNPTTSQSIKTAITQNNCCHEGNDLMHEAILGTPIPLPIHNASTYDVTGRWPNSAGSTILYEYHNGIGILSPSSYADVAVYSAFEQDRGSNQAGALQTLQMLNSMWDANGPVDQAFKVGGEKGVYQTFKDALYLLALLKTSQAMPANLEEKILNMQGADGGFNTGYFPNGTYAGRSENTETTSIVILGLEALFPAPWWETYWYLFVVPIAAVPVLLYLLVYYPSRRTQDSPSRPSPSTSFGLAKVE